MSDSSIYSEPNQPDFLARVYRAALLPINDRVQGLEANGIRLPPTRTLEWTPFVIEFIVGFPNLTEEELQHVCRTLCRTVNKFFLHQLVSNHTRSWVFDNPEYTRVRIVFLYALHGENLPREISQWLYDNPITNMYLRRLGSSRAESAPAPNTATGPITINAFQPLNTSQAARSDQPSAVQNTIGINEAPVARSGSKRREHVVVSDSDDSNDIGDPIWQPARSTKGSPNDAQVKQLQHECQEKDQVIKSMESKMAALQLEVEIKEGQPTSSEQQRYIDDMHRILFKYRKARLDRRNAL